MLFKYYVFLKYFIVLFFFLCEFFFLQYLRGRNNAFIRTVIKQSIVLCYNVVQQCKCIVIKIKTVESAEVGSQLFCSLVTTISLNSTTPW